jgi:glycosyltransferase involved in cell wall biosynthesis
VKIAIVTYSLNVGGIETFIQLLYDYCKEEGHEVSIFETFLSGTWSQLFRDFGYNVKQILPIFYKSKIHHAKIIAAALSDYDLIILNDAAFAQAGLGLLSKTTVVIPVLHSNVTSMIRNATSNIINVDMISAVSPAMQKYAIMFGAPEEKVSCIPNGITVPDAWPKADASFTTDKPFRLAYIGAINHTQKGVLHLPAIFADVVKEYPALHFDIIGDGPDLPLLRAKISQCDKIKPIFHGAISNKDAMPILAKADAMIMPSHFEGLGIVILEAMARGVVPIVSFLDGITNFLITDSVDGKLVNVGDEKGFAEAIIALAHDRNKLRVMSYAAWQTAVSRFSYQTMGASYLSRAEELRNKRNEQNLQRSGRLDVSLLGDFPHLLFLLVRPVRKILRILGFYKVAPSDPLLYNPEITPKDY